MPSLKEQTHRGKYELRMQFQILASFALLMTLTVVLEIALLFHVDVV